MILSKWGQVGKESIEIISNSRMQNNSYHNITHVLECLIRLEYILAPTNFSPEEKVLMRLAIMWHDYDHCGKQIKNEEDWSAGTPEEGLSNEEWAVYNCEKFLQERNFSERDRSFISRLILSTHFSGSNYTSAKIPLTIQELIIGLADVGGCFLVSWEEWVVESCRYLSELPCEKRPCSSFEWIQDRAEFISDFVVPRMQKLIQLTREADDEGRNHVLLSHRMSDWKDRLEGGVLRKLDKMIRSSRDVNFDFIETIWQGLRLK